MVLTGYTVAKMKLIGCCLLAVFVTVSLGAVVDVEKTVREVQNILKANQQLPRLTRDEILQLLNDIRSEDSRSVSSKQDSEEEKRKEQKIQSQFSTIENEIDPQKPNLIDNEVADVEEVPVSQPAPKNIIETTTKSNEPTLMVVLPYTPRDGSSLQELYTKPPRVEVVHVSSTTPKPSKNAVPAGHATKNEETRTSAPLLMDFPDELQAFLNAHGLKGKPGQDNFLLPLEGFKPLPPAKVIDGTVQLPENILLTYDLISPSDDFKTTKDKGYPSSGTNFLYEPLRPELPFELDTSSSETKETSLPYDMPVKQNYHPIDYESVKVIPLNKGINPINEQVSTNNDQSKRQASGESSSDTVTTTTTTEEPKTNAASDSASADTDSGASIADLEDSFGGAVPSKPGDSDLPPPRKNGFYWMLDWNSFLEVGDGDTKVNIRLEPKLGDPQMFLPVTVP